MRDKGDKEDKGNFLSLYHMNIVLIIYYFKYNHISQGYIYKESLFTAQVGWDWLKIKEWVI